MEGKSKLNKGRERVIEKFSFEKFSEQFVRGVQALTKGKKE